MRIDSINRASAVYQSQVTPTVSSTTATPKDEAVFSDHALTVSHAYKAAKDAPDMRSELVNSIKEQVQAGTYGVSTDDVSSKIASLFNVEN
ncbi:MAG: hypothetical protein ATN36_00920 [Epulopiscium sp. Nele67-Bin005]|nr:MAG: hypothetical protein ATN36_00920 [Epulopiscium sp. Nele67-Bin005]